MANVMTKREVRKRRLKFRIAAGLFDFIGTIGSVVLIFVCVILLSSLVSWLKVDAPKTFGTIYDTVYTAIMTDDILALEGEQPAQP